MSENIFQIFFNFKKEIWAASFRNSWKFNSKNDATKRGRFISHWKSFYFFCKLLISNILQGNEPDVKWPEMSYKTASFWFWSGFPDLLNLFKHRIVSGNDAILVDGILNLQLRIG